jgi:DNA polymerase III epsilon subunit-like protein
MGGKETYISVDVETSGPIPGKYSMLSLGACVVSDAEKKFYMELKPTTGAFLPEALDVSGLSMGDLYKNGEDPKEGMVKFENWISEVSLGGRPVFVAFNATFDWSFVNYYFHQFIGRNPFGISGLDIKAYYMGKLGTSWSNTTKNRLEGEFLSDKPHTHNALDDAIEQADIFEKLLKRD